MSEYLNKKDKLKDLLRKVHIEKNIESIKEEFSILIRDLTPLEIAQIEQELIEEGISTSDIQLMCDVHLDMFKTAISEEEPAVEPWHPISILMEEHKDMVKNFSDMKKSIGVINDSIKNGKTDGIFEIDSYFDYLGEIDSYFHKEENVIFPYMEKNGVIQPPKIMWEEHDKIRDIRKDIISFSKNQSDYKKLSEQVLILNEFIINHVYKEHKILFPSALKIIDEKGWYEIREQFDEIGYFSYFPKPMIKSTENEMSIDDRKLNLPSGYIGTDQIVAMLNILPVDITFVDENDVVRYFSETKDRIFVRSRAIVGRKVQNCHPPKSVHIVEKILSDFKSGKRDEADFYISMNEKIIYIRYFALRNRDGKYMGTVEVTQDIAPLRKIDGEKRIYDEK